MAKDTHTMGTGVASVCDAKEILAERLALLTLLTAGTN
jgi:hypothetical protein